MVGVGNTGIRSGIIGVIGCSCPLEENEKKVLRASAVAQQQTGAPITIHPNWGDELVLEIIEILRVAGADLSHTVIGHCDVFDYGPSTFDKIVDAGCYIEYDNFGQPAGIFMPIQGGLLETLSDVQRVNGIIELIGKGYLDHILMSCDNFLKQNYVTYGGYGYAHIIRDIVPAMRMKGMSEEQIDTILVENPKQLLQFAPTKSKP